MSVDEVRQASDHLYAVMNRAINGEISEDTLDIFSQADDVTVMHPMGGRQRGWPEVRASYEMAAGVASSGSVDVKDLQITILGDDAAYTTGTEIASVTVAGTTMSSSGRATNVYRHENGVWKLVHHHADIMPEAAAAFEAATGQSS